MSKRTCSVDDCERFSHSIGMCKMHYKAAVRRGEHIPIQGRRIVDRIGERYGLLTVIAKASNSVDQKTRWLCRCDCGQEKVIRASVLANDRAKSCGCSTRQLISDSRTNHGMRGSPTWVVWKGMKARCENPNATGYKNYGGRGITFCESWVSFDQFFADMGERPIGKTLDRIDVNGPYAPWNCRWATWREQANNRRPVTRSAMAKLTVDQVREIRKLFDSDPDTTLTFKEVAKRYSVSGHTIAQLVNRHTWKHIT